jgi:hypothetical protein
MVVTIKILLFLASLAAALCWFKASRAKAPDVEGADSWVGGSFGEKDGAQMLADATLQAWWNSLAASFATAAAILTAVDTAYSLGWL